MGLSGLLRRRAMWVAMAAVTAVAAVAVVAAVVVMGHGSSSEATTASTAFVRRGTVTQVVSAAGTVEPAQTRGLAFSMTGTVTELNVKTGDTVAKGVVLARIDKSDAEDAVDSATSRLSDADDALDRAETAATAAANCTSGSGGQTQGPTSSPAPSAASSPTVSTSSQGKAGAAAAPSQGTQNCGQDTSSNVDSVLSAQQQVNNAELSLAQAQRRLAGTVIKAPIAGRVLSVGGKVGTEVSPGGTGFIVLGDVSGLSVRAEVSEADVGRLAVGQAASITLPNQAEPVTAHVSQIDPAGTVSDRLVRYGALVAFDDVSVNVLLGQSATVAVSVASASDVLYVPTAAVANVSGENGKVTIRSAGREQVKSVRIGLRGEQYTEIADGLNEGDEVVLGGG
jgi:multidrug efflux pump subunit AcrA (membrane-fusion protein)